MSKSISEKLSEEFNAQNARPGKKIDCVICGKHTLQIKPDDTLAKCFHPECGFVLTLSMPREQYLNNTYRVLDQICMDCHSELIKQKDMESKNAYEYITKGRRVSEEVLNQAMIGVVPDSFDAASQFDEIINVLMADQKKNEYEIKWIEEVKQNFSSIFPQCRGWICFFYTDCDMRIVGIRLRKPYSKEFRYIKIMDKKGIFGLGMAGENIDEQEGKMIVVEGEFNLLRLQSIYLQNKSDEVDSGYLLNATAIGSSSNVDYVTIRDICNHPIIINDADDAGEAVIHKALDYMHVDAVSTPEPYNDLDEFINAAGESKKAWDGFLDLLGRKKQYFRTFESLRQEITGIRIASKKDFLANQTITQTVIEDLLERGVFYKNSINKYYFVADKKVLIKLAKDDPDFMLLMSKYGLNQSEKVYQFIFVELSNLCHEQGLESMIHKFAYYNEKSNTLYVSKGRNSVLHITSSTITEVDNGTDGVIFEERRNWEPFIFKAEGEKTSLFNEIIVSKVNFRSSTEPDELTSSEQGYLFEIWFYSLFFESIMPTKAIAAFIGVKGSGKSVSGRKVGILLHGKNFDVTPLPSDIKDFDAAVTNSYFLIIDNADTRSDWLEDRLATMATGGTIKVRALYTNIQLMEFEPHCFLALTSRTPKFTRDDIADRLLLFHLSRIESFEAENLIHKELLESRDKILSEVIVRLQNFLKYIEETDMPKYSGNLRMADFASFAYKFACFDKRSAEIEKIFKKISTEQSLFTLGSDPIMDLLYIWITSGNNEGRYVTYKELYSELVKLSEEQGEKLYYKNHRAFAQKMRNIRSNLQTVFKIKEIPIGANQKKIAFWHKDDSIDKLLESKNVNDDKLAQEIENKLF